MFYVHEKCKISDFKFSKVMQQHTPGMVGVFCWKFSALAAVKEFCKSIKNTQSYSHG